MNNSAYAEIAEYFRNFDPHHEREEEIFTKLGYIDIQHFAERIKAKTLWITGMIDMICPPSSQFAAYNKITAEKNCFYIMNLAMSSCPIYLIKYCRDF
ncbi:hypothetical protein A6K24_19345 [Metabacillus litoralis]|uniref:Acetyl xylan esterase domain-containing protein n=1 Tax=Metabacillus litoralis TaxID=152268 RepID=A0A179T566_9BACI|nr:hypothetical protein A6K24_19345 [Metabacillus litoralis]